MVLKLLHGGVISGRIPGIIWSIAAFRYALTICDRTETLGIPRLVFKDSKIDEAGLFQCFSFNQLAFFFIFDCSSALI